MKLNIHNKMSSEARKKAIQEGRMYLSDDAINPQVKEILFIALKYADDHLTGRVFSLTKDVERYQQVNELFNLGVDSKKSLSDEKKFYMVVRNTLASIPHKKSDLRDNCLPLLLRNEAALIRELEQQDQTHINAANGIVSASLSLGLLFTIATYNPLWLAVSSLALLGKLPATNYDPSPSYLGVLVYNEPTVRQWGNRLHTVLPVNLGYRMFNLFGRGTNAALNIAERTVTRIERIANNSNQPLYSQLSDTRLLQIENRVEEDDSYAARRAKGLSS